jgi:hypothetical protein
LRAAAPASAGETHTLSDELRRALEDSTFLVVVCSPESQQADWVQAEVDYFCSLGRSDRVMLLWLSGEPAQASHQGVLSMKRLTVLVFGLGLLVTVGCHSDRHHEQTAMQDACAHCSGKQMMTSKGTCEDCGMEVDCCAACAGTQSMTADGRCPECGAKMAVK